ADFRYMIPFVCHFAGGVFGKDGCELDLPDRDIFELAKLRGWSDDADDPGGATMVDVTLATFSIFRGRRATKGELRNIGFDEWQSILKGMFWDRCGADGIESQGLAHLIVDWVWASGPGVLRRVQKLFGAVPDGKIGPLSLKAINGGDQGAMFRRLMTERERYYRRCGAAWKYLDGWLRRLHAIQPDGSFIIYGKRIKGEGPA
ncbi:MAG: hypothetical protein K2K64_05140, partial [Muribaculaceae bacterium]|nr:hypothetical protein [Muribaculaceae bacterium]